MDKRFHNGKSIIKQEKLASQAKTYSQEVSRRFDTIYRRWGKHSHYRGMSIQFIRNKIHRHLMSFYKNVLKIPWLPKCTIESKHCKYFLEGLTVQNA